MQRIKKGTRMQYQNEKIKEINKDGKFTTDEESERYKRYLEAKKYNEAVQKFTYEHGGFTFLRITDTLSKIDSATVGRLAFLSTYLSFGNRLLIKESNIPVRKRDLSGILCLSRPTTNDFYNECIANKLLYDRGSDGIYMNDLFFRGKMDDDDDKQAKLYRDTIRSLYHNLKPTKHDSFGYAIQIIPALNWEWNVICENPDEKDSQKIIPLSLSEICDRLTLDGKHTTRLRKALTEPIFEYQGEIQQFCAAIETTTSQGIQKTLYVNPNLIYVGSDYTKVEGISIAFRPHRIAKQCRKVAG